MKRILLLAMFTVAAKLLIAQTVYFWVGGAASASVGTNSNWNTSLNGSGSARTSSTTATDILVFDGTNFGGATTVTGPITVNVNTSITCAQIKFTNNANVSMIRSTSGTSTVTISGGAGDDFTIDAGSTASITSQIGSIVLAMASANSGRVSGNFSMVTSFQARIANTTTGTGNLVFENGSTFTSNITAASAAYPFGNSTQSSEKWVIFQAGSHLYYDGGFSPMASSSTYSPIDFQAGSVWHHRANNPATGFGSFFNTKSFANISVENGATLAADGPIYRIDTLTVTSGSSFITHTTGSTVVRGNIIVDGSLSGQAVTRNNTLVIAGSVPQSIGGAGVITVPALTVADNSELILNRNISGLDTAINVYGKINFGTFQLSGAGSFTARANASVTGLTGALAAGSTQITGVTGTLSNLYGLTITGTGIPANTIVLNYSQSGATINLSKPVTTTAASAALSFQSGVATLATSNTNGFDATSGSVAVAGNHVFQDGINYIINAATAAPFGITTGTTPTHIEAGSVTLNAPVTTNTGVSVSGILQMNTGKLTVRALDTVRVLTPTGLQGSFGNALYVVTTANATGAQGVLRIDGFSSAKLFPVGSPNNYLPATITPTVSSDFAISSLEGITVNGLPSGAQLSSVQKQTKVDAVWNINRVNGSGSAIVQLAWPQQLEGSTFATLTNADIGVITNNGTTWSLPTAPGDNAANTASNTYSSFGAFGVGAQPPAQAFVFNPLPSKTYGDADFNGGAFSANSTQPIIYTSSNPAVATIVSNTIHITGVGTTNITATQATDGFYPAVSVTQPLTVVKANLTITADNKSKPQGDPNPTLTVTYTGFVYGQTSAVLTTPVTISTTATASSPAGTYPIVPSGATATNYNITFVNGTLTVTPRQNQTITFNALPVKTYGNADFLAGGQSSNASIAVTYTSSNPSVATVTGSTIHIVGAGTTTITASQAGNAFFYAAPDVSRVLTVNKANLTVRAVDTSKVQGQVNPPLNIVYTGFVLGETASALSTAPTASTVANTNTAPGYYPIVVDGGVSSNYNFVYTAGRLTIYPSTGTAQSYLQAYMSNSTTLVVKAFSPVPDIGDVYVFDMAGRMVKRKNVFIAQGFLSYEIPVTLTASGIYVVKIVGKTFNLKTTVPLIK